MHPAAIIGIAACVLIGLPVVIYIAIYNGLIGLRNRVRDVGT